MRPEDAPPPGNPLDDLDARGAWLPTLPRLPGYAQAAITDPGLAALHAVGGRAPRRSADRAGADPTLQDNWRPVGPRNVGGRVRALARDPGPPVRWYAGPASGGVHVSRDGGSTWFPLWHGEPSLAVGAVAVAPSGTAPRRVYVATGEPVPNGFAVRGHGIWVSDDGGETWDDHGAGGAANPGHIRGFDALAVHPTDPDHCWAVGGDGVFRTLDGGRSWDRFRPDERWTDAVFAAAGQLYLARGTSHAGEAVVVRLDAPAGATDGDLAAPANTSVVIPSGAPPHVPWPARSKLALAPSRQRLAYVRVADEAGRHAGLFRSEEADPAHAATGADIGWERLADHDDWLTDDDQGTYCLCIAVHPTRPEVVATGMVHLYVSTDARDARTTVTWRRALHWALHDEGLREHHADNHTLVVDPDDESLWVANDGGIARSDNWHDPDARQVPSEQPLPADAIRWVKRDHGITAAQMYDCNQSPLLPSVLAAGMQDNGVHMTAGGLTWRTVFGADGGFVAFDPDDPYRFLVTWQGGIAAMAFPGHADLTFPGEDPAAPVTGARTLDDGFLPLDGPAFVADTDRHPTDTGRLLHTRRDRLYGTRTSRGETFGVEPVGRSFELHRAAERDRTLIEVLPTGGALRLGLVPGHHEGRATRDRLTRGRLRPSRVAVPSRLPGPFALRDGDEVRLVIDGTRHTVRFSAADAVELATTTVAEVVARFTTVLPDEVQALPRFWPEPLGIELVTRTVGAAATITLGGSALDPLPDGRSRLDVAAGTYRGTPGRPASVTLALAARRPEEAAQVTDFRGPPARRLTVAIDDGAAVEIQIAPPGFPDPRRVTFGQLAAALRSALANEDVEVVASPLVKAVALVAEPGGSVVATGTAAGRLGLPPAGGESVVAVPIHPARRRDRADRGVTTFDLHDPAGALRLSISDGSTPTSPLEITGSSVADLAAVTPEELHVLIDDHLSAHPGIAVRADLLARVGSSQASEVRFSTARPDEIWVGGEDGVAHRSLDDGSSWVVLDGPVTAGLDGATETRLTALGRPVEAIALHPADPDTAYVGLHGRPNGPADPGFLFRTRDGGATWEQVGVRRGTPPAGVAGEGAPLPVHALEVDPRAPDTVFAATPGGVFRSGDGGDTWEPFNEGLPNCPVTDLAHDPVTRTLTAAVWGRGAYQRHVGAGPPQDVRVHVRATDLDVGGERPARSHPDVFGPDPGPAPLASPDIKVSRRRPPGLGPDEAVDGVAFDLDVPVDDIVAGESAVVWTQVHNRGAFPARSTGAASDPAVRVLVLRAAAPAGPPPLAVDIWTQIENTPSLTGALGDWTVVLDRRLGGALVGGVPAILSEDVAFPADLVGAPVGLLTVVVADDDARERDETDVVKLLATDRQVAYREVPTITPDQDRRLLLRATGPAPFRVDEPAGAGSQAARLDVADADRGVTIPRLLAGVHGTPTYDLDLDDALVVAAEPVDVTVGFDDRDAFQEPTAASPREIAAVIGAHLAEAGGHAGAYTAPAGLRLRARGGARVRATAGAARDRLGLPTRSRADAVAVEDSRAFSYDLDTTGILRLEIIGQSDHTVDVPFRPDLFSDADFASPRDVAVVINRALHEAGLLDLLRCEVIDGVGIYGERDNAITVAGPAAAALSLARVDTLEWFRGDPGVVDAPALGELRVAVTPRVEIAPHAYPGIVPDVADATPAEVRRMLNHALRVGRVPVRAEVPLVDLRVGRSTPDTTGAHPVLAGAHLAELVGSENPDAITDPDVRAALFDLRPALEDDRLRVGEDNELFLRVSNAGNIAAVDAEHRLFTADVTAEPIALSLIGAVTETVPPAGSTVVHLTHDPAAGPDHRFVLAVSDPAGGARAIPAEVPDLDGLLELARQPGAALRRFGTQP